MQLALSPLSSFFFSCLLRYFSPLQSIHFRDFRSSALKKKKENSNPTFFFSFMLMRSLGRAALSVLRYTTSARRLVFRSYIRDGGGSLKDFHFNSPLWHNFLASTVDSTPPLLLSPLILFFSHLCFVVSPTSSPLTYYVFAALAPPSGHILGFGINFSCYVTSCFSIKEPH